MTEKILLTQKIRIYPTEDQEKILWRISHILRSIWNFSIQYKESYTEERKFNWGELQKLYRELRNQNYKNWKNLRQRLGEMTIRTLHDMYKSWWKLYKKWIKKPEFDNISKKPINKPRAPRYKNRKQFQVIQFNREGYKIDDNKIIISYQSYSPERLVFDVSHYPIKDGNIKQVEIYQENNYKKRWFISVIFEIESIEYKDNGLYQAFDLGVKDLVVGVNLKNKFITVSNKIRKVDKYWEKKIQKLQQRQSKCRGCKKGEKKSRKWREYQRRINLAKTSKSNQVNYFLHGVSKKLVENTKANTLIIGDLNVKQMAKRKKGTGKTSITKANKTLNRRMLSGGLSRFSTYLEYKSILIGKKVIKIDEKNTTKECCICGNKRKMELSDRIYKCDKCGNIINRDENSAVNIMKRFINSKEKYDFLSQEPSVAEGMFLSNWKRL